MKIYLKLLTEGAYFALGALWANKLRTFLSLLGITIGIFAVIAVFTIVDSYEKQINDSLNKFGNEVVYIERFPWTFGPDYPWWKYINRPDATYKEYNYIHENARLAAAVCYMAGTDGKTAKFQKNEASGITVMGVSYDYNQIRDFEIAQGRYFSYSEAQIGTPAIIIGTNIATQLFDGISPIDRTIEILGRPVRVVGVFAREGKSAIDNSLDDRVIVPIGFFKKVVDVSKNTHVFITIKPRKGVNIDDLKEETRGLMRSYRRIRPVREDNFAMNQVSLIADRLSMFFGQMSIIGWIVGGFSILVGGFGIANIMFVSVHERTNIIGIQKALGAKRFFILFQFLIEAIILSLLGGLLGLLLVYGLTLLLKLAEFDAQLNANNIILGLSVSVVIGVVAGILPALRASKLDPVEAIRAS
jgi:putative ABC transport system permease protein